MKIYLGPWRILLLVGLLSLSFRASCAANGTPTPIRPAREFTLNSLKAASDKTGSSPTVCWSFQPDCDQGKQKLREIHFRFYLLDCNHSITPASAFSEIIGHYGPENFDLPITPSDPTKLSVGQVYLIIATYQESPSLVEKGAGLYLFQVD